MIDPVELAEMPPDAQRLEVIRDLALACERALAVLSPADPLVPGLVRASAGFQHLAGPPRPHLRGLPRGAAGVRAAVALAPLLSIVRSQGDPKASPS